LQGILIWWSMRNSSKKKWLLMLGSVSYPAANLCVFMLIFYH
jgi:hypothetical protein